MTINLAITFFLFNSIFILLSLKKNKLLLVPSLMLLFFVNYSIRPVLSKYYNYWLDNKYMFPDENSYNIVYIHALAAVIILQLGYLTNIYLLKFDFKKYKIEEKLNPNFFTELTHYTVIISLFVGYLILRAGFSWLSTNRETSASLVIPEFRLIFPLFIFLSLTFFFNNQKHFAHIKSGFSILIIFIIFLFFFTLFSQRGFLIYILLMIIPLIKNKKYMYLVIAFLMFFIVFFLRAIGTDVSNDFTEASRVLASNGDSVDTWFIVLDMYKTNGITFGSSMLLNIAHILPLTLRVNLGLLSSLDRLNIFYFGDEYLNSRFGYNCDSFQDLFLNFGYLSYPLLFFLGLFLAFLDKKFIVFRSLIHDGKMVAIIMITILTIFAFGTIQWLFLYYFIYLIQKWFILLVRKF
jgi:hypothetical protein